MPSQYQTIEGVKYERDILVLAKAEQQSHRGQITHDGAIKLWESAMDGNRVTPTERRTLEHILTNRDNYRISDAGRAFLEGKLGRGAPSLPARRGSGGKAYYRTISGVQYKDALLERAEAIVAGSGAISRNDALKLWAEAHDGNGVTECERRTLMYISENYSFAANASEILQSVLGRPGLADDPGRHPPAAGPLGHGGRRGRSRSRSRSRGRLHDDARMALVDRAGTAQQGGEDAARSRARPRQDAPLALGGGPGAGSQSVADGQDPRFDFGWKLWPSKCSSCNRFCKNKGCKVDQKVLCRACFDRHVPGAAPGGSAEAGLSDRTGSGLVDSLAPAVLRLLRDDGPESGPMLEIADGPGPADAVEQKRAEAVKEVARILSTSRVDEILGGGTKEEKLREFRRLALLLHPDKPWARNEESFVLAYRLIVAAKKRVS